RARKEGGSLNNNNDDYDRIFESFRDALDLFAAAELWEDGGPRLAPEERQLLAVTGRTVVQLFSPRGNEQAVATALFVLQSLEPKERAWTDRLQQLFAWLDTGTEIAGGARAAATTPAE